MQVGHLCYLNIHSLFVCIWKVEKSDLNELKCHTKVPPSNNNNNNNNPVKKKLNTVFLLESHITYLRHCVSQCLLTEAKMLWWPDAKTWLDDGRCSAALFLFRMKNGLLSRFWLMLASAWTPGRYLRTEVQQAEGTLQSVSAPRLLSQRPQPEASEPSQAFWQNHT